MPTSEDTRMSCKPGYSTVTPSSDSVLRSLPEMLQHPLFKLRFINSPSQTIFTASRIEAEDGSPIEIELVDAVSNTRVTSDSLSFSRLEIVALDADLTEESWTTEVFNRNVLWSREGQRPLLVGDLIVTLKSGVGVISGDVAFTDNSTWLKDGKFRLGAKATEGGVVEAITNAFACIDHIGKLYPNFDVWGLDNIDGVTESRLDIGPDARFPPPYAGLRAQPYAGQDFSTTVGRKASTFTPTLDQKNLLNIWRHGGSATSRRYGRTLKGRHLSTYAWYDLTGAWDDLTDAWDDLTDASFITSVASSSSKNLQDANITIASQPPIFNLKSYDVVIRYRRGDVSNEDFISHLRAALSRKGISVHGDFDEVDALPPECKVLIIFLTSTYVPSNLLKIVEQQPKKPRVVYPIFYGISPSDLISNINYYERFFLQDEPKRWQDALKEISQMPGFILLTDTSESELIDEIVKDALNVLRSYDMEKMIGLEMQIKEILSLLCIESPDVRSVGIWGTVGIGKTAIAEEVFFRISVQFKTCVFLKDLHKEVEVKGYDAVREDFLSKVLEVDPHIIRISGMKTSFLRGRLQRKRVLLVLDDVNDFRDVEIFLGKLSYLGPGSRIIITSRNRRVFVLCKINHVYEVKPLDNSKSLTLLDRVTISSFFSLKPDRTYSPELVKFSNGNPQVLQFLCRSNRGWKQLSQEIQRSSPICIPGIFERSCCGLDDNERSIFLDIACFFKRAEKNNVAMLLDGCGFSAHVGFRSLVDKSLLVISHNMVDMLRFLQATGREIVRQESKDRPGDRTRLWNAEEIRDVFIDNTGTSAIEGIFLDMSQLKLDASPNVFEKMYNLRLLKLYFSEVKENHGVSLPQGLEYLPSKLRLLHWEHYPVSSLPQNFDPKNLVEVNLPNSCVKKLWKGEKSLEKLKKMRLSYSYQLTKIPRLSRAPSLELLDLEGCSSLVSISQSICYLKKLVFLNLKDCSNLESVPSTVDLESLEVLNLSGCSKIENFPEISPNVKELYMGGTMIQEIPSSIKNLVLLEKLDLENSRHLVNLPTSICKLKHLETLNLSGCSSLERFPDLSRKMKCLKSLDLSRTAIKELAASISNLTALEELRFVDCKSLIKLPDNAWSLRFKVEFRQIDTEKFSKLWNRFGWLKKVQIS